MAMGGNHSKLNSTTKSLVRLDPLFGSFKFVSPGSGHGVVVGWMDANAPQSSGKGSPARRMGGIECAFTKPIQIARKDEAPG